MGSFLDNGNSARKAGAGILDLEGEAGDGETGSRKLLQVGKFLNVTIADVHAGSVTLPDQTGVARFGIAFGSQWKRCVPAPSVGAGQPYTFFQ